MELLPPEQEREELLDELAALIVAGGAEPFLAAPIVMPDDETFPDAWDGGALGVYRLLRRIQTYAGLGELELSLVLDEFSEKIISHDARGNELHGHEGVAGWFAGIERNTCYFGVDLAQLASPDALAGTLAHEVAHAYRAWLGVTTSERMREELRTDLTSIYLGFGILTANSSLMFRSGQTANLGSYWKSQQGGYLPPQSLCFLLAAQVVARGASVEQKKAIARRLETNQAACFRAACDELERDVLLARLGLPLAAMHPRVRSLPAVEFDDAIVSALALPVVPPEKTGGPDDDDPTFRITRGRPNSVSWLVAFAVAAAIAIPLGATGNLDIAIFAALATPVAIRLFWPRQPVDECAYKRCGRRIPADALRCPGCLRPVGGTIESEADRLDAADDWHAKRRRRRRGA